MNLRSIATALGGKVYGTWVCAPGPNHSKKDRSLAITLDPNAPEGFRVHSFCGDDWRDCLEYVREKMGLPQWEIKPDFIDLSGWHAKTRPKIEKTERAKLDDEEPSRVVQRYTYKDSNGNALYRVCRTDPKGFYQERREADTWVKGLGDIPRVLYRQPDLVRFPDATVFFCEGEKDVERLVKLGHTATTIAYGAWSGNWGCVDVGLLKDRDILILEDNDEEGRRRAQAAADTLDLVAKTIRIVRLPGLPEKGDVSDWLDMDMSHTDSLVDICFSAPIFERQKTGPVDLWATLSPPELPAHLLPVTIERFAREMGALMGADPAGLAMACLAVCAAAIPGRVRLQVKVHEHTWLEGARLWVALIGQPSTKKSPILAAAARPLIAIDKELQRKYAKAWAEYDDLSKEERKETERPKKIRLRIEDVTMEAAQDILRDSDSLLCLQDEMTAWFGGMDKYSSGPRGSAKDRGFWLSAFNGSSHTVDRVGRGQVFIERLSISLLGGIQPDPMRKLIAEAVDDGLIQRLCPVMLRPSQLDVDVEAPPIVQEYNDLVRKLHKPTLMGTPSGETIIQFSHEAQAIRRRYAEKHQSMSMFDEISPKLGAHLGKLDGIYARLCLIWHCIEHVNGGLIDPISASVAGRVGRFMHDFMVPHAAAFYASMGTVDTDGTLQEIAGFILAHPELEEITFRSVARAGRSLRKLSRAEVLSALQRLELLGWVDEIPGARITSPSKWKINPNCRPLFAKRAAQETERRQRLYELIRNNPGIIHEG